MKILIGLATLCCWIGCYPDTRDYFNVEWTCISSKCDHQDEVLLMERLEIHYEDLVFYTPRDPDYIRYATTAPGENGCRRVFGLVIWAREVDAWPFCRMPGGATGELSYPNFDGTTATWTMRAEHYARED